MLIMSMADTEKAFSVARAAMVATRGSKEIVERFSLRCQHMLDVTLALWVEWNPYTPDARTQDVYVKYAEQMTSQFKAACDEAVGAREIIDPLIAMAKGPLDQRVQSMPGYFDGVHGGYRRMYYWFWFMTRMVRWEWKLLGEVFDECAE